MSKPKRVVPGLPKPVKVKKTCCRSTPRCTGCPVVVMRLERLDTTGMSPKKLAKAVKRARAA